MKKLLLSNDDGVHAGGLRALYETLSGAFEVRVVAPDRDKSGASNSLTLSRPLSVNTLENGFHYVDGTPADCVYLGVSELWPDTPDMVVAGINHGGNLGDDVLYSGTVAAAMEGRSLGLPAMAVSLCGNTHFETAARAAAVLLSGADRLSLPPRSLLNVNVPDVPWSEIKGFRVTRLGHRGPGDQPLEVRDPRGRARYWIALAGSNADDGGDTDFAAVSEQWVSITPLMTDLTRHSALADVADWLSSPGIIHVKEQQV
ncbi:5'/3'-nucleotidase SurE [Larsenimonas rhizosphaerae]|uniref:5'-nucleotidase SurE n=1 Tax=Larsenimonas rhizosphaerae TaxID=2944682 RepID=A0AA41ZHW2_9GAMM|nr:5'/3'-nucleotidase SurE [Larsenimonas rhizosphaerae]MCM2131809.1 5'/3'-nucleotidase SurE [Larsenimonas rhizosphaerae]MCX2524875.1 5'/3'-nucleotidase SurE [Larsenimonas rhizosphaerae]